MDLLVDTPFCTCPMILSSDRFLGTLHSLGSSVLVAAAPVLDSIDWI